MKEQKERIEKLLERYFDALATDAEEQELRAYFRTADKVDADLLYARTMFCGMDTLAAERLPGVGDALQSADMQSAMPPSAELQSTVSSSVEPRQAALLPGGEAGRGTEPRPTAFLSEGESGEPEPQHGFASGGGSEPAPGAVCTATGQTLAGRLSLPRRRVLRLWGMAAAAVVAFCLLLCVEYMRRPYCYIDGIAVYDKDAAMQATVYLQGFAEFADPVHLVDELIMND